MKRLILFLGTILIGLNCFGQNGGIYADWHLTYYQVNGINFVVSGIVPPISPTLTIDNALEISGIAACNNYSGNFIYDAINDRLVVESFEATTSQCDFQIHTDFETDYFNFFTIGASFIYDIIYDTNGDEFLLITLPNVDELHYSPYPIILNSSDSELIEFDIYPNPASTVLSISSESSIQQLAVYSVRGQQLISMDGNTDSIDVSFLVGGIYLLEIISENGRQVKKFIVE